MIHIELSNYGELQEIYAFIVYGNCRTFYNLSDQKRLKDFETEINTLIGNRYNESDKS